MLKTLMLIVGGLIGVGAIYVAFSWYSFSQAIDRQVAALIAAAAPAGETVTEEMVAALPPPVQRFLIGAGVVGRPIPSVVRLKQAGRMRSSATAAWMQFEAEQVYTTSPPAFVWRAHFPSASLPIVFGRDEYAGGSSSILMKAAGTLAVADIGGAALGEAGLMRYLNEMMWFPAAYLAPNVTWGAIDDSSARVSITDSGITAAATLFFDEAGRITNFRARRFNTETRSVETWETPISRYGDLDGLALPVGGQGVWKLADGDFAYIELDVVDLTAE